MAVTPTYPGVYVQEVPSGVRTIVGVSTSTTLFIGRTRSGPLNRPVRVTTYTDFARVFGEDNTVSDMTRYLKLFFLNGGADAWILRIAQNAIPSTVTLENEAGAPVLLLTAKNAGTMGDSIRAAVTYNTSSPEATFNLELFRWETLSSGARVKVDREEWLNLGMDPASPTFAPTVLTQKSKLVDAAVAAGAPAVGHGASISGRLVIDNNTIAGLVTTWEGILSPASGTRTWIRVSVDGQRAVDVDLDGLDFTLVSAEATIGDAVDTLGELIRDRIVGAYLLAGITLTAPLPAVTFASAATVGGTGRRLVISSARNLDVRVTSMANPAFDVAALLMLGEANGGTEPGAFANHRPAPTGISLRSTTAAQLDAFALLLQTGFTSITLDELDATGAWVPRPITFNLVSPPPGSPMWRDSTGGHRGVREKLGIIRDAVNAYQLANPSRFFWRAELWGNRLALIKNAGEDTALHTFVTAPAGNAAFFTNNIRYYPLGLSTGGTLHTPGASGDDGTAPLATDYEAAYAIADREIDLFNLLVLPPDHDAAATPLTDLWPAASIFCQQQRAFLIMDDPGWTSSQDASTGVDALRLGLVKDHAAVYFPRLSLVEQGLVRHVGAAGAMAGLYARIDGVRGVWKAPAGTEADLRAVTGVDLRISDLENGQVNPVGVNAIRVFPDGVVSWGSRTLAGSDILTSEYKYVPIRRLALFIEESLYRGLKWVVFEPNDTALWAQIRLNVGSFMQDLFRKGAFAGTRPAEAFFVKCDAETTTESDRNLGIVNVWVGFAPLKPAEFVILYLQQMAGQLEAQG